MNRQKRVTDTPQIPPIEPAPVRRSRITGADGKRGVFDLTADARPLTDAQGLVTVRLDDGRVLRIPARFMQQQDDGAYIIATNLGESSPEEGDPAQGKLARIPVIAEELLVQKRQVEKGRVRVFKRVHEREEVVDETGYEEDVDVEHVPVNQVVDGPVQPRYEGETLVIPLLEEVLVVEKRLVLKEEVRITKRRRETRRPQTVTLRREEAVVERSGEETGEEREP